MTGEKFTAAIYYASHFGVEITVLPSYFDSLMSQQFDRQIVAFDSTTGSRFFSIDALNGSLTISI